MILVVCVCVCDGSEKFGGWDYTSERNRGAAVEASEVHACTM